MIEIKNLSHFYEDKKIIDIKEWKVNTAEQWILIGNSGSGKTTLLHILAGLLKPSDKNAQIYIQKQDIQALSGTQLDTFRAKNIGLIFQKAHLIPTLNVIQNLLLVYFLAGVKQNKTHCQEILAQVNLTGFEKYYPEQLSVGQAHRVAIARALLLEPTIILADEPSAGLDDENTTQILNLLKEQTQKYKACLLIATHDARVKQHFDKILHL
ncbi:MAG: ATP-binding cassette domain-containing protein [Bacteroidetes bacterium]|nr:MAG: ATP-binding cassette domain-containing protein [Bacteroidota bacterium]